MNILVLNNLCWVTVSPVWN